MEKINPLIIQKLPSCDQIVIGLFEGEQLPAFLRALDLDFARFVGEIIKKENFKAVPDKYLSFYYQSNSSFLKVFVAGLGKKQEISLEKIREAVGRASQSARSQKAGKVVFLLESFVADAKTAAQTAEAITEASELALYRFKGYKAIKKNQDSESSVYPEKILIAFRDGKQLKAVQAGIRSGTAIAAGIKIARDLINEPGNRMNPEIFSKEAKGLGKKYGFSVRILEKKELERENMGALLAVGQGSMVSPRMVIAQYKGRSSAQPIGLVGKGITFDSGGISIKPSKGMEQMKYDMAGGGAVLGALITASLLKLPVNLVAVIPLAENMPSGGAIKPGDVVRAANGASIEVVNTDAEGRLILADALHYMKRFKPKAVFDLATLTGAVTVVLGSRAMAAMGDHALIERLKQAGDKVNERVWELPLWSDYDEDIKSEVADFQNVGKGEAGVIIGGKFLEQFVGKAYPWVHLDIASVAWVEKKAPSYCPKGARGVGIRLLIEYLRNL